MIKLYIGNLDYTTTASRLRREFEAFGRVTVVFLPTEPGAKQHKGFGFVTFADRPSAEEAISKMDQSKLDGRTLRVNESKPRGERPANIGRGGAGGGAGGRRRGAGDSVPMASKPLTPSDGTGSVASVLSTPSNTSSRRRPDYTIRVNNISEDTTESALWMLFQPFGLISRVYIAMDIPKDKKKPIKSRGFALVSFVDQEDALRAMAELQGHRYDYMILKLEWERPRAQKSANEYDVW